LEVENDGDRHELAQVKYLPEKYGKFKSEKASRRDDVQVEIRLQLI